MKKKSVDSREGPQVRSQNRKNDHFGDVEKNFFFFLGKKVRSFFGVKCTENYYDVAIFIIISRLRSKVEETKFFIVLSTFDRDPEIIMKWFPRHSDSR